ncbi:DNA-binding transcriptional MerR regulator [Evansella vedderi]|uniref:DNA-binding transcriptional MerR regulator n=1 Tax=Evansella vedderi TaxID=38282 RepID=A0ABU0A5T6_9BACI|nr:MerR family transcriptional regulator [Evansella vedderi]MDQ0258068.1 DNA-binding transcriptional MerR regulator [Evansella vedderi]
MNFSTKEGYFSTAEFAKLIGVTKHTLFHYDKMGVFSPKIKLKNNYRLYSFTQFDTFLVLSTLKELGMSLKEIKSYLDKRNPNDFILLLEEKEKEMDEKIAKLTQMKKLISNKASQTRESLTIKGDHIFLTREEEACMLVTNALEAEDYRDLGIIISKHIANCKNQGLLTPSSIGQIIHIDDVKAKNYLKYSFFFTKINSMECQNTHHKKAGEYINILHNNGLFSTSDAYKKILEYAQTNKLILDSYFYEDIILDELSVYSYEDYTIKISVRISD